VLKTDNPAPARARGVTSRNIRRALRRMRFFSEPFRDLVAAMDAQVARASRPKRAFLIVLLAGGACWWVYVPVHELLHALGCYVAGGSVSELQIAPRYGGTLLARVLPFVVGDGDYAGRLSGFDTKGSDLIYLATDALPFLLSVFIGVPLLKTSAGGARPALLGVGFVLGLAPFYSLTGDYYEMGSIITTRAMSVLHGAGGPPPFATLRSDDVVKLVSDVFTRPGEFQVQTSYDAVMAVLVITIGLGVGVLLAFGTYAAGARLRRRP
jgi:hypothetical protein